MLRDVARNQCRTDFLCLERRHLLVQGADTLPLGAVQHRQVDGTGNVVVGKFAGGTDVDDLIEGRKVGYGGGQTGLNFQGDTRRIRSGCYHCHTTVAVAAKPCLLDCSFLWDGNRGVWRTAACLAAARIDTTTGRAM